MRTEVRTMELLTTDEACDYLDITPHLLKRLRERRAISYLKLGHKTIKYRRADLENYLDNCLVESISTL